MNIFDSINNEASLAIILWLLGAAIIGFATAWFYWSGRYKKLEKAANETKEQLKAAKEANAELQENINTVKATNHNLSLELDTAKARIKSAELEKGDLYSEMYKLKDNLKLEQESKLSYGQQLEGADEQIARLQSELADAQQTTDSANDKIVALQGELTDLQADLDSALTTAQETTDRANHKIATLQEELAALQMDLTAAQGTANKSNDIIAVLKGKIAGLQTELGNVEPPIIEETELTALNAALETAKNDNRKSNARIAVLRAKLEGMQEELMQAKMAYSDLINAEEAEEVTARGVEIPELSDEEKAATATVKVTEALGAKISAPAENKDDLTVINGIGTFIEKKLNKLGINSYQQLTELNDTLITAVTEAIQFFPGRIKRDDWVGQAKTLLGISETVSTPTHVVEELSVEERMAQAKTTLGVIIGTKISKATEGEHDDFKAIDGIGPFIEAKLNELGIRTYRQLSEFDEEVIQVVTDAIAFFPGRIERDQWVEQAKAFLVEGANG